MATLTPTQGDQPIVLYAFRQKVKASSTKGCSYMLTALWDAQDLLQPIGLLETYFCLKAKSTHFRFFTALYMWYLSFRGKILS